MLQLQWQKGITVWKLVRLDTKEQIAWADKGPVRGATGQIRDEKPKITVHGVHRLRQIISKEVDRRSIGLFGVDDIEFLPPKN